MTDKLPQTPEPKHKVTGTMPWFFTGFILGIVLELYIGSGRRENYVFKNYQFMGFIFLIAFAFFTSRKPTTEINAKRRRALGDLIIRITCSLGGLGIGFATARLFN